MKDKISTENDTAIAPSTCYASLTHGSLFSGIGGFDLASDWMGWENIFHCEWNDFGKRILKYYWPNAISYDDITKTDFTIHRGTIDILTGGFPCQPYSSAGQRKGKEDERHLWPEMLRAIREIQPTWIVGENVLGIVNWNGGMVFDEVQADLENEGYEITPFLLPACAVNAPHRRDRVWFVAYSHSCANRRASGQNESKSEEEWLSERNEIRKPTFTSEIFGTFSNTNSSTEGPSGKSGEINSNRSNNNDEQESWRKQTEQHTGCSNVLRDVADTERIGQQGSGWTKEQVCSKTDREWKASWAYDDGRWPTQSPICNGNDGFPTELDGITISKWKQESIKGGGNAIVPQVALQIFKAVAMHNASLSEA